MKFNYDKYGKLDRNEVNNFKFCSHEQDNHKKKNSLIT